MICKIIANKHVLYYRELGEAPKLRKIHAEAKESRLKNHLDIACEYLEALIKRPECVRNYELKNY